MSARAAVVLSDSGSAEALAGVLRAKGHTVEAFTDPMDALTALERTETMNLLITGVRFPAAKPNGCSLALMARMKCPGIRLIFICTPEEEEHVATLGRCLRHPVDVPEVVDLVMGLLDAD